MQSSDGVSTFMFYYDSIYKHSKDSNTYKMTNSLFNLQHNYYAFFKYSIHKDIKSRINSGTAYYN
jgi:hypothetical protein